MSEKTETNNIRMSQVLAGALAAVTAALLGSTMGVAGTVVGAGLASVVSTVGGALYLRSIQRTRDGVRTVRAKVVGRSGGTTVMVSPEDPADPPTPGEEVEAEAEPTREAPPTPRRLKWPVLVAGSVLAFVLGMMAITGVEWIRGESLSGGAGTTFGSIVERDRGDQAPDRQESPSDEPSVPPTSTSTGTSTGSTSSTAPTTTTTPSPSDASTPPTTTTTTTTGEQSEPPAGTVPPSN
jgi:hypothetical protein